MATRNLTPSTKKRCHKGTAKKAKQFLWHSVENYLLPQAEQNQIVLIPTPTSLKLRVQRLREVDSTSAQCPSNPQKRCIQYTHWCAFKPGSRSQCYFGPWFRVQPWNQTQLGVAHTFKE